jgi:hypothetical protein
VQQIFQLLLLSIGICLFSGCTPIVSYPLVDQSSYIYQKGNAIRIAGDSLNRVYLGLAISGKTPADFPPILSMHLEYAGYSNQLPLGAQDRKKGFQFVVLNIEDKSSLAQALVKDKIKTEGQPRETILLMAIMKDKLDIKEKAFTFQYGLWEKRNPNMRFEQTFTYALSTFELK